MNRVDEVKRLLGDNAPSDDFIISHAVSSAASHILSYCNIDTIPNGLEDTLIDMAIQICKSSSDTSHDGVETLKEGDMSVTFARSKNSAEICADYNGRLDKYRKLRW